MALIFPRWTNSLPAILAAGGAVGSVAVVAAVWYWFSPAYTDVGYQPPQPVPFSHRLHAGEMGLDCRYCHNTVERAARAAVPPSATCMNCHKVIKKDSDQLALVRTSATTGTAIHWRRVHLLPDYTYFDHSAHLAAGVGCSSCHGRIDLMNAVAQEKPLSMSWCLECHRNPEPHLRPREQVTNMGWDARRSSYDPHQDPTRKRQVTPPLHCSGCHR